MGRMVALVYENHYAKVKNNDQAHKRIFHASKVFYYKYEKKIIYIAAKVILFVSWVENPPTFIKDEIFLKVVEFNSMFLRFNDSIKLKGRGILTRVFEF